MNVGQPVRVVQVEEEPVSWPVPEPQEQPERVTVPAEPEAEPCPV